MEGRGKLLAIEGLDGSGKSTQVQLLVRHLESKGHHVFLTKEPTKGQIGLLIKKYLDSKIAPSPIMMQLLFAADRLEHFEKEIKPALEKGMIVVCDRYVYSSIAYGIGADFLWMHDVNKIFPQADLTIYLKVPPVVCFQRITSKHRDAFETAETLEAVAKNYDRIAKTFPNIAVVDGNRPLDEVFHSVQDALKEKLDL